MSTSTPALTAAYESCLNEALLQCPLTIKRWCSSLSERLQERASSGSASSSETRLLQDAAAALKTNRPVIEREFALELTRSIADDGNAGLTKKREGSERSLASLRFDQLELMGDEQVQQTLDGARLQQFLQLACEAGLGEFSARLSTAQGFKMVQVDKNPLRPEIIALTLLKLLRRLPVDNDTRSRWLTHGSQLLGKELQALYLLLEKLLKDHGVAVAPYAVLAAPDDKLRKPSRADQVPRNAAGSASGTPQNYAPYPVQSGLSQHGTFSAVSAYSETGGYALSGGGAGQTGFAVPAGLAGERLYPASLVAAHAARVVGGEPSSQGQLSGMRSFGEPTAQISREQLLTLDHLHRLMVGDYNESFAPATSSPAGAAAAAGFSPRVSVVPGALAESPGLEPAANSHPGPLAALPMAQLRDKLKSEAKTLGQALGIEVIGLMMEQLSGDNRLLPTVRQLVAGMEPAFLRLGMTDPRFFSEKSHPARQLLEAITAKSMAYPSEDAPGFAGYLQDIQEIAAVLQEGYLSDEQDFATLLRDFDDKHTDVTQALSEAQNLAIQALLRAEQRNLLAEKIAAEIRARADFVTGNRPIVSFLTGPWAHVMANERLLGERSDAGSFKAVYALTLGDLLWSLDVAQAASHRQRLVQLIPEMLNAVRDGLLSIDFPLEQAKDFYDALMRCHQAAMKPAADVPARHSGNTAAATLGKTSTFTALERAFEAGDDRVDNQPWLAPAEAQQSGFIAWNDDRDRSRDVDPPERDKTDFAPTEPASGAVPLTKPLPLADAGQSVELALGAWVELLASKHWLRAQLTWISPHNTLFMFTSEGGRGHSMTSRVLQQRMSAGQVKVISARGVLEGALDNVARTAMRNSIGKATQS